MFLNTKARAGFRAGTALLVAAVVGSLVAPVSGTAATASAEKARTSISIRVTPQRIEAGETAKVLGNLNIKGSADEAGRTVTLEAKAQDDAAFEPVGDTAAGPHGKLRMDVTPDVTTRYRWHYAGAEDARPRRSGVVRVTVGRTGGGHGRLSTTLSIRAPFRLVDVDGDATILGRLRSHRVGVPHRRVILLSKTAPGTGWSIAGRQLTDRHGHLRFEVGQEVKTAYRLKFWGDRVFKPSRSGVVRIGVRPLVTIVAIPDRINPGETTEISGVATYDGAPLVGAAVDLKARKAHSRQRFAVIATGTTGPDGSVAFTDDPTRDTVYRLVAKRTADVPRGVSPAAKVKVRFPTSLSIRGVDKPNGFRVSGALRGHGHPLKGAEVTLQSLAEGATTWTAIALAESGGRGVVRFLVPISEGTSYRLYFEGNRRYAPSYSGVVVD